MSKVYIKPGFIESGGKQVTTLNDALKHEADCGCGIDCCNGWITLPNIDGDGSFDFAFVRGIPSYRQTGTSEWSSLIVLPD